MAPCPPPFAIGAAAMLARELVPAIRDAQADADAVLDFCRAMRVAAVGKLLLTARPREFFADLERSAQAFAWFLRRGGVIGTGRAQPFFDAVASGDDGTAAVIAAAAPRAWQRGSEYEDDFLYVRFLMDFADPAAGRGDELLARWRALAESPDPRLDCCIALQQSDAGALDRALRAIADGDWTADLELIAEGRLDPDHAVTTAHVHVEGLAIVRLATSRGIAVDPELPRMPSLARRVDLRSALPSSAWQHIEDLGFVA